MKILVIRFSSIGDIVLTTPIVRCLQQIPGAEVHYLTKASFVPVLEANPYIRKIHTLDEDWATMITALRQEQFEVVIDLHKNVRSARVRKALGVTAYDFPKLNVRKWLLVNLKINLMPDKSIVERYFEAVKPLGVHNDGKGLDYFIPEAEKTTHKDIPMSHWAGYVGFVIGGSYATKKLPVEQWRRLCELSPIPVILLGGPEDREAGEEIAGIAPFKVYNSCGKFSLNESADLVKYAKVLVSNDTGLMHIGAAFQKPIVSLWGNTSPEMGMFPYYGFNNMNSNVAEKHVALERKNLSCHPCSKLGYGKCPKGHFKCMKQLEINDVVPFFKKFV
ncbi:glycosyltransferase family 9 protein [Rurimicrobium arvi]|uniref:Glycosyltransferase family 9 protein n=1 Tax=Rurimicrobium arvi TaxID=2049916 RepID=A0ABP8MMW9_9BACT